MVFKWKRGWNGHPAGPPETWGRGKRVYTSKRGPKPKPHKQNCPFCDSNQMESHGSFLNGDDEKPRMVWQCPLGCGLEYPLCRGCFPDIHHQPRDNQLVRWDAIHLTEGCGAPESELADGVNITGRGRFTLRAPYKDLRRYTALLAAEIYRVAPGRVGYELCCHIRGAARGQLIQAEDWRRALIKMPLSENGDAPRRYRHWKTRPDESVPPSVEDNLPLSCALAAAATQIVTQAKIHTSGTHFVADEGARGRRYMVVAESCATAAGVSEMRRAELQVKVQIGRWSGGEKLPKDVQDAATAAVLAGNEPFARKLVEIHANDARKLRSAGG